MTDLERRVAALEQRFVEHSTDPRALLLPNSVTMAVLADFEHGTTFPTAPGDGDIYVYNADLTNGVKWVFQYRAASASSFKWEFIGGAPLVAKNDSDETFTDDGNFNAATTDGPTLTLPLAGDYDASWYANMYVNGTGVMACGLSIAGGAVNLPYYALEEYPAANNGQTVSLHGIRTTGRAAADTLKLKYLSSTAAATANCRFRGVTAVPVRVVG